MSDHDQSDCTNEALLEMMQVDLCEMARESGDSMWLSSCVGWVVDMRVMIAAGILTTTPEEILAKFSARVDEAKALLRQRRRDDGASLDPD